MPLTDTHIRSLKPDVKPRKYFDGGGLFLFVPANGSKLWRMAYRFDGKSKLLSFGEYPTVSLKDARERREEAKRMLSRGIDPSDHKRQLRQARAIAERDSFQNIAREWHETRMAEFSEKHQGTVMYRWRPTFFRPSARRISPNLRHGTLWRSSSLWNRGETTRLPGEYCKSSVRCSAMRSSRAGRNTMSQPICGEPCDREKLFTGRQCWNRRKSVSFCGISTPMKAISLWSVP